MWSGSISLGMVSIPVTIAKAWSDEREKNLRDVCAEHHTFVDRTERCSTDDIAAQVAVILDSSKNEHVKLREIKALSQCGLASGKLKGVELESGEIRALIEAEYAAIEDKSASDALEIVDYQAVYDLPMEFGTGTYYVRYNPPKKNSKVGLDVLATFTQALAEKDHAAVVWWKRSGSWKLCALHVAPTGELLLTQLPQWNELRQPGNLERAHVGVPTDKGAVAMFQQLMSAVASDEFDLSSFENEALALRTAAVEKILAEGQDGGDKQEQQEDKSEQKDEGEKVPDLMKMLQQSMKGLKKTEGQKEEA
jgi:non-homologous end joining protein Ku